MAIGVIFAGLALAAGLAVARGMRLPSFAAPSAGLAGLAIVSVWCAALGAPPRLATSVLLVLALAGLATCVGTAMTAGSARVRSLLVLAAAVALPAALLGAALAGVQAPLSTHDGAFHVETVDAIRHGVQPDTWYPIGFHAMAAAVLGLMPWLDSAQGTAEVGLGLALLAPLALFGVGRALGFAQVVAGVAAVVLGLTWIYPYDYHLWGGWPQGMGVLLVLGLWLSGLQWLRAPRANWAVLFGLLGAAVVLTHGIDLFSAALGLGLIAAVQWRSLDARRLVPHGLISLGVAIVASAPYLPRLLGWAGGGGATEAALQVAETSRAAATSTLGLDWLLQVATGATGAGSAIDLPLRLVLLGVGIFATWHSRRVLTVTWLAFVALPLLTELSDAPPVRWLFVVTYPWLADQRPREIAVVLASLLEAAGVVAVWSSRHALSARVGLPNVAARRLAVALVIALGFFAEGSGVSIYKRLLANVAEQDSFSADDSVAMAWLRQHAAAGSLLINDRTADAGIWAPYKADVPILLPRSAPGAVQEQRGPILDHLLDLNADARAQQQVCALGADYVYSGARPLAFEARQLPDRAALQHAPYLREVFVSGDAAVFRIDLPCG